MGGSGSRDYIYGCMVWESSLVSPEEPLIFVPRDSPSLDSTTVCFYVLTSSSTYAPNISCTLSASKFQTCGGSSMAADGAGEGICMSE